MAISENSSDAGTPALRGENTGGGKGVHGTSQNNDGVFGESQTGRGVSGFSHQHTGVVGESKPGIGVHGISQTNTGTVGESTSAKGVHGISQTDTGVFGQSESGRGVHGASRTDTGVLGESQGGRAIHGISQNGIGVHGRGGRLAGFFEGDVEVTGDIRLSNADCAEQFDIAEMSEAEPGTVMVLTKDGSLQPSSTPYDKRVVGVVSGAGNYKPGIILDQRATDKERRPIALLGKVYCKVDARHGAIETGDLLTTSDIPGHAMKATDQTKAFGTIIGKALWPLQEGQGLIPVLVALQ